MAAISSGTLDTARRRNWRSVSSLKQRSAQLSHDAEVGRKWRWTLGWHASHRATASCL